MAPVLVALNCAKVTLTDTYAVAKTLMVTDLKKMVRYRTYPVHSPVSVGEGKQGGEAAAAGDR